MTHFPEEARKEFLVLTEALATAGSDDQKWLEAFEAAPIDVADYYHCSDIMPEHHCNLLDLPLGSSYAEAAQMIDAKADRLAGI
jgi:hypothetical protein